MAGGDHHHGRARAALLVDDAVELAGRERLPIVEILAQIEPVLRTMKGCSQGNRMPEMLGWKDRRFTRRGRCNTL